MNSIRALTRLWMNSYIRQRMTNTTRTSTCQRLTKTYSVRFNSFSFVIFFLIRGIILEIFAAIILSLILAKLLCEVLCQQYLLTYFRIKHFDLLFFNLMKVSLVLWCRAVRHKASVMPSHTPAWKCVLSGLQLTTWTMGHFHPAYFFVPGSKEQFAHRANTAACLLLCM